MELFQRLWDFENEKRQENNFQDEEEEKTDAEDDEELEDKDPEGDHATSRCFISKLEDNMELDILQLEDRLLAYNSAWIPMLKCLLSDYGLPISGSKSVMFDRLKEYTSKTFTPVLKVPNPTRLHLEELFQESVLCIKKQFLLADSMSNDELEVILYREGLPTSGRKHDMFERLHRHLHGKQGILYFEFYVYTY